MEGAVFYAEDKRTAFEKLTVVAAKYDKNGPGAVPLTAFDAAFLTPVMFKEVLKRTFSLVLTPRELSAMIATFKDEQGNVKLTQSLIHISTVKNFIFIH